MRALGRRIPWLILGILLLAAAAALVAGNLLEQRRGQAASNQLLEAAHAQRTAANIPPSPMVDEAGGLPQEALVSATHQIDGVLSLPTLGLELPVLSSYSEELLRLSPCVYQREGGGGRTVVAGHNYRAHFGRLPQLQPGDPVTYQPQEGDLLQLEVLSLEEIDADDRDALDAGAWEMTLLTCNLDQTRRILVRLGPAEASNP